MEAKEEQRRRNCEVELRFRVRRAVNLEALEALAVIEDLSEAKG